MLVQDFIMMLNKPNFIGGRRTGKTTALFNYIRDNEIQNPIIVCHNRQAKEFAEEMYKGFINNEKDIIFLSINDIGRSYMIKRGTMFFDELGLMDLGNFIGILGSHLFGGYTGTMPQANMRVWKTIFQELSMEEWDSLKKTLPEDIFNRECLCKFDND